MKHANLTEVARSLGISAPFLCEIRKGKKSFSKHTARRVSESTGIPLEKVLFADGESLYRELERAYGKINFRRGRLPLKKEGRK